LGHRPENKLRYEKAGSLDPLPLDWAAMSKMDALNALARANSESLPASILVVSGVMREQSTRRFPPPWTVNEVYRSVIFVGLHRDPL
jgi:hypothetical protein